MVILVEEVKLAEEFRGKVPGLGAVSTVLKLLAPPPKSVILPSGICRLNQCSYGGGIGIESLPLQTCRPRAMNHIVRDRVC